MLIMNNCSSWNKEKYKTAEEGAGGGGADAMLLVAIT